MLKVSLKVAERRDCTRTGRLSKRVGALEQMKIMSPFVSSNPQFLSCASPLFTINCDLWSKVALGLNNDSKESFFKKTSTSNNEKYSKHLYTVVIFVL